MNCLRIALQLIVFAPALALADVEPAVIHVPETTVWTGQKATFHVELRAAGTFDGAASFSLPQIPRSVIIKVGNPVVSSQEIDGDSWFIQTHEFALFSQQSGMLTIPSFEVRFASRDGFTGPVKDQTATVSQASFEIQRPPGSKQLGFLVTTPTLDISETWDPQPGPAKLGDVFKRTILQSADEMTGIALAPPPQTAPQGVRVYFGDPEVTDKAERGSLSGQRRDTITYVMQQPGIHTLPAVAYIWWNPKSEQLQSKSLPAVTFEVAAPPVPADAAIAQSQSRDWIWWLGGALLVCGLLAWQRERMTAALAACWHTWNPPDRVAARRLQCACRDNDAAAASRAWTTWLNLQPPSFQPTDALRSAAVELERHVYGPKKQTAWQSDSLQHAFREQQSLLRSRHQRSSSSDLPRLNPAS